MEAKGLTLSATFPCSKFIAKDTKLKHSRRRPKGHLVDEVAISQRRSGQKMRFAIVIATLAYAVASATPDLLKFETIFKDAESIFDFVVSIRRQLHQHPELMYQEYKTSDAIKQTLDDLGIKWTGGWGENKHPDVMPGKGATGIVADIGTGQPPCVALRADIDALPILEKTELPFKSKSDGCMHACGHDGHTSMLLGAAKLLKSYEPYLNGTVRLIFQPAEEGGAGGKRMREEGALKQYPPAQRVFGMHLWPTLPSGVLGGRAGPSMAATDVFDITVAGVGGHAAMPHLAVDPIVAAAAVVTSLQSIVSRQISPLDAGVVSVTKIRGGDAYNVIPDAVNVGGTIRSLTETGLDSIRQRLTSITKAVAGAHNCNVSISFMHDPYPPVVNNPDLWQFVRRVAGVASANGTVVELDPTMGGEDFAFLAQEVPGAFIFLGQGSGEAQDGYATTYGLHNPRFTLHERVMKTGVALHAHLALQSLADLNKPDADHTAEVDLLEL